jgi:hypothetical protein
MPETASASALGGFSRFGLRYIIHCILHNNFSIQYILSRSRVLLEILAKKFEKTAFFIKKQQGGAREAPNE